MVLNTSAGEDSSGVKFLAQASVFFFLDFSVNKRGKKTSYCTTGG